MDDLRIPDFSGHHQRWWWQGGGLRVGGWWVVAGCVVGIPGLGCQPGLGRQPGEFPGLARQAGSRDTLSELFGDLAPHWPEMAETFVL